MRSKGFTSFLGKIVLGAGIFYMGYCSGRQPFEEFKQNINNDMKTINSYVTKEQQRDYVDDYVKNLQTSEKINLVSGYMTEMQPKDQELFAIKMYNRLSDPARERLDDMIIDTQEKDRYDKAAEFMRNFVNQF